MFDFAGCSSEKRSITVSVCFPSQLAESNVQSIAQHIENARLLSGKASLQFPTPSSIRAEDAKRDRSSSRRKTVSQNDGNRGHVPIPHHPHPRARLHVRSRPHVTSSSSTPVEHASPLGQHCENFAFPPPPPPNRKRIGHRRKLSVIFLCQIILRLSLSFLPSDRKWIELDSFTSYFHCSFLSACPVCYLPVEDAISSMPNSPTISPVLKNLTYIHDENPMKVEPHGGSYFGGYPSLEERNGSFDIKESMKVHCG